MQKSKTNVGVEKWEGSSTEDKGSLFMYINKAQKQKTGLLNIVEESQQEINSIAI